MQNGLNDKNRENRIRRLARRHGCVLRKSRARKYVPTMNDWGEFMVIEADRNLVVLGERFNASLDDIEWFLGKVA
jgi:hypothetical protein